MQEEYDHRAAEHYAAFRPPLHSVILAKLLQSGERLECGLDIGCGTGHSSIALAEYCEQVVGLEPSKAMIAQAIEHPSVKYVQGTADALKDLEPDSFDIVTFAGSIFYAKSRLLYDELLRTVKKDGLLLVYDFEVLLDEPLERLGLSQRKQQSDYQFTVDLSEWTLFREEIAQVEEITISLSSTELSHLILADSLFYAAVADQLQTNYPFEPLVDQFQQRGTEHQVSARLYYSRFRRLRKV